MAEGTADVLERWGDRWKRRLDRSSHGPWLLGGMSYLESTVVPIPLEVILIPYMVARRERVWSIATWVTVGCLLGALTGYAVGFLVMDTVGTSLVETFGWSSSLESFRSFFDRHGFFAIVGIGVVPVPFQVAMLVAGAAGYPIPLFVLAATIARGIRYFGLAGLVAAFGDRAERLWREHTLAVSLVAGAICAGLLALSIWRG